jgi:hypothetical protein
MNPQMSSPEQGIQQELVQEPSGEQLDAQLEADFANLMALHRQRYTVRKELYYPQRELSSAERKELMDKKEDLFLQIEALKKRIAKSPIPYLCQQLELMREEEASVYRAESKAPGDNTTESRAEELELIESQLSDIRFAIMNHPSRKNNFVSPDVTKSPEFRSKIPARILEKEEEIKRTQDPIEKGLLQVELAALYMQILDQKVSV